MIFTISLYQIPDSLKNISVLNNKTIRPFMDTNDLQIFLLITHDMINYFQYTVLFIMDTYSNLHHAAIIVRSVLLLCIIASLLNQLENKKAHV